jgi:archaemetzincin
MKKTKSRTMLPLGVIPMGRLGDLAVHVVAAHLQTFMEIPVDILEPREVPEDAFQHHRQQFDAGTILKYLADLPFPRHSRIVGLTNVDLCIPILTHVFGEAEVGGRVAVVSNFRLRKNDDGTNVPMEHYYERLAKVALHEVGHTLSIYHCDDSRCVMAYSPKVHHLDKVELFFCERCKFILRENFKQTLVQTVRPLPLDSGNA